VSQKLPVKTKVFNAKFAKVGGIVGVRRLTKMDMNYFIWIIFNGFAVHATLGRILPTLTKLEIKQTMLEEELNSITRDVTDMKNKLLSSEKQMKDARKENHDDRRVRMLQGPYWCNWQATPRKT